MILKNKPMKVSTRSALKILHCNISSVRKKRNELRALLQTHDPDIIIISEHWLSDHELCNFTIPGYIMGSAFSRTTKQGGGVFVLVKDSIDADCQEIASIKGLSTESTCELCAINIKFGNYVIYVIGVYRSPTCNKFESFLETMHSVLLNHNLINKNCIIAGD